MNADSPQDDDERPAQFAKVPAPLIRYLKPGQLNTWAALKLHDWGGDGIVWPSQVLLAQETGQSERTVRDVTKQLHDMGVLRRRPRGHSGFEYHLADIHANWTPAEVAGDPAEVAGATGNSCQSDRQELPVLPAELAAEVDTRNRAKGVDPTEADQHESETPASGGFTPPAVGPGQAAGRPEAGTGGRIGSPPVPEGTPVAPPLNLEEELLANDPAFLAYIEAKRAERPTGSWYRGGWSHLLAMRHYRTEIAETATLEAEKASVGAGGLDSRLLSHREPSALSPEERRKRQMEDLGVRLRKHR